MDTILSIFFKIIKQRSVHVFVILSGYLLLADILPPLSHQIFYSLSLLIKDSLIWIMPLTVCFFIANSVSSFERKAPLFIIALLFFEAFSNLSSVWYAYFCAEFAVDHLPSFGVSTLSSDFTALWRLPFNKPSWWSAEKGAILGLVLGCLNAFHKSHFLTQTLLRGKGIIEWILTRIFARLIPLFILGFAVQLYQTNV